MSYYYPYPYYYPFQYSAYSPFYYGGFPGGHSPYDWGPHYDVKGLDRHYIDPHIDYHGPRNWPMYNPYYWYY